MKPQDLDKNLQSYFRAEMPNPWPDCPEPRPTVSVNRRANGATSRWALAASLFLFGAYFLVAGLFPASTSTKLNADPKQNIGKGFQTHKK